MSSWALITPACPSLFTSDPTSDYFKLMIVPGYRLGGCGIHVLQGIFFVFFLRSLQKRPSNILFQIARGSGATPSWCTFFAKSAFHLEVLTRTLLGFSLEITRINLISTRKNLEKQEGF
jgi:hypothetical protein